MAHLFCAVFGSKSKLDILIDSEWQRKRSNLPGLSERGRHDRVVRFAQTLAVAEHLGVVFNVFDSGNYHRRRPAVFRQHAPSFGIVSVFEYELEVRVDCIHAFPAYQIKLIVAYFEIGCVSLAFGLEKPRAACNGQGVDHWICYGQIGLMKPSLTKRVQHDRHVFDQLWEVQSKLGQSAIEDLLLNNQDAVQDELPKGDKAFVDRLTQAQKWSVIDDRGNDLVAGFIDVRIETLPELIDRSGVRVDL